MSISTPDLVVLAVVVGVILMAVRQRGVYRTYQAAQRQVLDRQAEVIAVQRESLEAQKEMVRLLQIVASRERS
jgi:hypothetical protein